MGFSAAAIGSSPGTGKPSTNPAWWRRRKTRSRHPSNGAKWGIVGYGGWSVWASRRRS